MIIANGINLIVSFIIKIKSILESPIILVILSLIHLAISLVYYGSHDWIVQWSASVGITHGVNLYYAKYQYINGITYQPPHHFPIFFYIFAFIIKYSGYNRVVARGFLWASSMLLTFVVIKEMGLKENKDKIKMANYFLLSPILFGVEFMGKFDQFVMIFLILGITYSLKEKKYILFGGFILGLGVMTKIYVIFAVGIMGLSIFKVRKISKLIIFLLGITAGITPIFYYFYSKLGEVFIDNVFYWQLRRLDNFSSIWFYIFSGDLYRYFIFIQFTFLIITFITLFFLIDHSNSDTVFLSVSTLFIVYILFSKIIYPHYMLWIFVSGFPAIYSMNNNSQRFKSLWRGSLLASFMGSILWIISTGLVINSIILQLIGIVILYSFMIIILIIHFKILITIKNNIAQF